jgi:hypothetical protein
LQVDVVHTGGAIFNILAQVNREPVKLTSSIAFFFVQPVIDRMATGESAMEFPFGRQMGIVFSLFTNGNFDKTKTAALRAAVSIV